MPLELREIVGNVFSASREYSLAHCVGADFRMGRGISVGFRSRFGRRDQLVRQNIRPGGVAILEDRQRFVYYLVTKELSYQPATYEMMLASLKAMRAHTVNNGIDKLAIPRLGCGLDKLNWARVRTQIMEVFAQDSIEIVVYKFVRH